jgi:hypothetical protein
MTWGTRKLIRGSLSALGAVLVAGLAGLAPITAIADTPSTSVSVAPATAAAAASNPNPASVPSASHSAATQGAAAPGSGGSVEPASAEAGTSRSQADADGAELTPGPGTSNVGPVSGRSNTSGGQVNACGANATLSQPSLGRPSCPIAGGTGSAAGGPAAGVGRGRAGGQARGNGSGLSTEACTPTAGIGPALVQTAGCTAPDEGSADSAAGAGNGSRSGRSTGTQPGSGAAGSGNAAQTVIGMCLQSARAAELPALVLLLMGMSFLSGWLLMARSRARPF